MDGAPEREDSGEPDAGGEYDGVLEGGMDTRGVCDESTDSVHDAERVAGADADEFDDRERSGERDADAEKDGDEDASGDGLALSDRCADRLPLGDGLPDTGLRLGLRCRNAGGLELGLRLERPAGSVVAGGWHDGTGGWHS